MRKLTVKYDGVCAACGEALKTGDAAMYERRTGIFCVGCEPVGVEDVRAYRQEKADRKADKYDGWAEKREVKAVADLNSYPEMRHDLAFQTQPGHIPARARMIESDGRAYESLETARRMRDKADDLRHVQVKGDAERERQAVREALDKRIFKGSKVTDGCFGDGVVVGVYKKSYRIKFDNSGSTFSRDKSYVLPVKGGVA